MARTSFFCTLLYLALLSSCRSYHADVLFKTDSSTFRSSLNYQKEIAENNYKIQVNDKLTLKVYTNEGEKIIDPDNVLESQNVSAQTGTEEKEYLVESDGNVKLPMVGSVHLAGYTLEEAEEVLQQLFSKFYKQPYVILSYTNKRVIVLGATGGKVIPLNNENMNLLEVLALAGGIPPDAKAYNIRLIRGDLKNPQVQVIDLTTMEGLKKADLKVYSGDIVYVEPVHKIIKESFSDYAPFFSLIISLATLYVLIKRL